MKELLELYQHSVRGLEILLTVYQPLENKTKLQLRLDCYREFVANLKIAIEDAEV